MESPRIGHVRGGDNDYKRQSIPSLLQGKGKDRPCYDQTICRTQIPDEEGLMILRFSVWIDVEGRGCKLKKKKEIDGG